MTDHWGVYDAERDNLRLADSKSDAEEAKNDVVALGADPSDIEIRQPGNLPAGVQVETWCEECAAETTHEVGQDGTLHCTGHDAQPAADGSATDTGSDTDTNADTEGEAVDPEIVDHSPDDETDSDDSVATAAPDTDASDAELPAEPDVDTDPLTWMPGEFIDQIDGSPAINRKGFAVLKQRYDISVTSEVVVGPEETDHEFARVAAHAEDADGVVSEAHGSASTDRGDDATLLLELADTRAKKRALSAATGVGMIAVAELQHGGTRQ